MSHLITNFRRMVLAEDDRTKERNEYVIGSEMLVEMLEESIRIFWEFVRSDKDCGFGSLPVLHSPQDLKMLMQLRRILQKVLNYYSTFATKLKY